MAEKPKEQVETAPDPDEDDLDDLDDVLDQFNAQPKPAPKAQATTSTGSSKPQNALPKDDELAAQLQAGMADLMGELDSNPEMQKEFERMMQELVQASQAPTDAEAVEHIGKATEAVHLNADEASASAGASSSSKKSGPSQQESFQDTVRKTMERMQASGASADAAAASDAPSMDEDIMAQLMKELQAGGGGGEEDINKMIMGMMSQLTNKEILYEPMKELHDKFPGWMEENRSKTGKEDLARYEEQHEMVKQIVGRFERKGYSDDDADDREFIVEKMQRMQAAGSPPPDLVGDMSAAQEALGELEGGCPTQ